MTFGLGLPDPADPKKFKTKLTYDDFGRTCNVCVRIGQKPDFEYLWGLEQGQWKPPMRQDLGRDPEGHRLIGAKAVWGHPATRRSRSRSTWRSCRAACRPTARSGCWTPA